MTKFRAIVISLLMLVGMVFGTASTVQAAAPSPTAPPATTPALNTAHRPVGVKASKGFPPADKNQAAKANSLTPCGNCYKYSAQFQTLSATDAADGASINFSVHKTFRKSGDAHTLAELAVSDGGNVIEVGWNVDLTVNGDEDPHVFVGSWVNGTFQGYNGGGGYTDALGCSPCAGGSLLGAVGTTKQFNIDHIGTNWWVGYNGAFFGAFPDSTWTAAGQTFVKGRSIQPFGEINVANDEACTDMGSGAHAGAGASASASSYGLYNSSATAALTAGTITVPSIWAQTTVSSISFRYGGEGYNSIGTAIGVKDHCAPNAAGTPAAATVQPWAEFCPDGQTTTGCNNELGSYNATTAPLNTCVALTAAQYKMSILQNNFGVSGRSIQAWATSGCTGGTSITIGNGGSANPTFEPHAIKRTGN
jgi:hypothetical protein